MPKSKKQSNIPKLPHNSLSINAGLIICTLIGLIYINSLYKPVNSPVFAKLEAISRQPLVLTPHLTLGKYYLINSDLDKANYEIEVAKDLVFQTTPENEKNQFVDLYQTIISLPQTTAGKIDYWQQILNLHPDYKEAHIQLIYNYYNQKDLHQAKLYLFKLLELNPNYLKELPPIIQNLKN